MSALPELPDREAWARASALLDELFELPAAERAARLDEACGDDGALRGRVERLLAADEEAGAFLDTAEAAGFQALAEGEDAAIADDTMAAGARIGPWRVVRELGRGGMGDVFLAERADGQFQQQVALKVIKRGMDTDEVLRRFLAERQILARLQHPHIARLLDGGVTEDGRPYFAMEYVEGQPIVAYCLERGLTREGRLRLFQDVCGAVAYAHHRLVVHRDLKPSNILITAEGKAKLLDFGIAKLLDSEEAMTLTGERVMTPEYAAPEQVRAGPITTATDVFTLGLLLYELLTGLRWKRSRAEDVPRVGQGDLDAILETALRDEPEKRYPSVEALAEDVRRFLRGLPVVARKGNTLYRARKFVWRHRVGVAAVATLLVAAIGLAGMVRQARVARAEAVKARVVKDFLQSVFEATDPNRAKGEEVTARQLLERGASRVEEELAGDPALQAELLGLIAQQYYRLGLHDRAAPLFQKDLALRQRVYGDDSVEVAESLSRLSDLHSARANHAEAEALRRRALDIDRLRRGQVHPATVSDADALARSYIARGRYDEAKALTEEMLERIRRDRGEENEDYATTLNTRQMRLWAQGQYAEAEVAQRRVLEIQLKLFGERHTRVAESYSNLGTIATVRGDAAEAERMGRRALAIGTALYGPDHPNLGITLNNLARAVHEQGRVEEAISLQRRAIAARTRQLGEGNAQLAVHFHSLALMLRDRGEHDEAVALLRQAMAMNSRSVGDEHPSQAITSGSLALVLSEARRGGEAEPLFRRSIELFRKMKLEKHAKLPEVLEGYGLHLVKAGRANEAEPLLREAVDRRRQAMGDDAWRTAAAKGALAHCLEALGHRQEARSLASQALPVLREKRGEAHPSTRLVAALLRGQ